MLKVDRGGKTLNRLSTSNLKDAQILERTDLQEYIYNSSSDFFAEIGEQIFVVGKEVAPSKTVADRIDLLGIDSEGATVVVELKRGSNKLHMLQAISYAGMVARWGLTDFRALVNADAWEQLSDFLKVDIEDINRRQRLLLVAEAYDYALLAGAEWLSEQHGVDIRCSSITLASDKTTGAEYIACTSIFPPPELAAQAAARSQSVGSSCPLQWQDWQDALSKIENEALRNFIAEELSLDRRGYLRRRGLYYYLDGKRRWNLIGKQRHGYVWQSGRFTDDVQFWQRRVSEPESVTPVRSGTALSFKLTTQTDLHAFREAATKDLGNIEWFEDDTEDVTL